MRQGFDACIRMCDVLTVSTKTLSKVARKAVRTMINIQTGKDIPIMVVDNRIDPQLAAPVIKSDRVIVGWQGSNSHIGDLGLIADAFNTLTQEYRDVEFQLRGCEIPYAFTRTANLVHKLWTPVSEYLSRMPRYGWSIALAPVTDHPFNESKSCLKQIEAGYCGIPCLASWVDPYVEFANHDRELKWLLCAGRSNWLTKLRTLINEPEMREDLGRRMKVVVDQHYTVSQEHPHEGWLEAIRIAGEV
jgi:glycosyltransferase involved in cell wall biosynthesis